MLSRAGASAGDGGNIEDDDVGGGGTVAAVRIQLEGKLHQKEESVSNHFQKPHQFTLWMLYQNLEGLAC
jgi:hypothetical protein